jgi:catechol 2,3-dioxygenase-like lactoylglutathione lyase family enzyme
MSTTDVRGEAAGVDKAQTVDMKLEVIIIPVSDVDRAKEFYATLGWRFDGEFVADDGSRSMQFTPPGSWCSIQFGTDLTPAPPGSGQGLHLVVTDIEAARDQLQASGVETTEVYHCESGYACRYPGHDGRVDGPHPERGTYGSFVSFDDPDGNGWILQEVTTRFPGRVDGDTTYASAGDLSQALQRAATAHKEYEARTGRTDPDWPDWYADYLVREQAGEKLPS